MRRASLLILGIAICAVFISNGNRAMGQTPPDSIHSLRDDKFIEVVESQQLIDPGGYLERLINYKCYEYSDYVILVREQWEGHKGQLILYCGDEIVIKRRDEKLETENLCAWPHEGGFFRIVEWAGYFHGVYGDYLLVEIGTAPTPRALAVYSVSREEKIYGATYHGGTSIKIDENQKLIFYKMLDKEIHDIEELESYRDTCPEIEELKHCITDMGGIGLYEKVIINLESLEEEKTGIIKCTCHQ